MKWKFRCLFIICILLLEIFSELGLIQCYARFTTHFRSINVLFLPLYLHVYQRTDVVLAILVRIQEEEMFFSLYSA